MSEELKTLQFKTIDVEPESAERILIELGGEKYEAHCPNDYEFVELLKYLRKVEEDPSSVDVKPILHSFFRPADVKSIDRRSRDTNASIRLIAELIPALNALSEHYRPIIQDRMAAVQKKLSAPKGR